MVRLGETGLWLLQEIRGSAGREHFRLLVNQESGYGLQKVRFEDPNQIIHPGHALAGPRNLALGPDRKGKVRGKSKLLLMKR